MASPARASRCRPPEPPEITPLSLPPPLAGHAEVRHSGGRRLQFQNGVVLAGYDPLLQSITVSGGYANTQDEPALLLLRPPGPVRTRSCWHPTPAPAARPAIEKLVQPMPRRLTPRGYGKPPAAAGCCPPPAHRRVTDGVAPVDQAPWVSSGIAARRWPGGPARRCERPGRAARRRGRSRDLRAHAQKAPIWSPRRKPAITDLRSARAPGCRPCRARACVARPARCPGRGRRPWRGRRRSPEWSRSASRRS